MKRLLSLVAFYAVGTALTAQVTIPHTAEEDVNHVMSAAYWNQWDAKTQAAIDADIERYRKADAYVEIPGLKAGTEVHVQQTKHAFFFGAHIFNWNQLGSSEANAHYRELYGTLFNSATVAFYWKTFEDRPGRLRFREEYWDTEEYWNTVENPKHQFHWRRPAPDPIVDYLTQREVRIHGHTIIWGNRKWQHPDWIESTLLSGHEREIMDRLLTEEATLENYRDRDRFSEEYNVMSNQTLSDSLPQFAVALTKLFQQRIERLATYYGDRISSWDVVNESTADYVKGIFRSPVPLAKSEYGIMPGNYVEDAMRTANRCFPKSVRININDYWSGSEYSDFTKELLAKGCRIDVLGSQMHLFKPQQCLDLAEGKTEGLPTPESVKARMARHSEAGLPIHLSEITITAPGNDERGRMIQAILTRNLYRLWFSIPLMEGITWWNVVDDCGAPGEPSVSGLFNRDMTPKPAYFALEELINKEWKTDMQVTANEAGRITFRGFKGDYLLTWKDKRGREHSQFCRVE
ncbi:MAG: endo-1,4-beta-xylanase [Bacteroidaceae bacterium]|nr:endo-1,4-beta-xylanase [Bacteroidaceae bacterium]